MADIPLGRAVAYPERYAPEVLAPIPRRDNRRALGLGGERGEGPPPFHGADIWNAWELSWLDARGKPQVAVGRFIFPCASPNLVESKSLKLYLGSFSQERLDGGEALARTIQRDLSRAAGADMQVMIAALEARGELMPQAPEGTCVDELEVVIDTYEQPDAALLGEVAPEIADEVLYSDLFRSRCPITGQPDWGSVTVCYHGPRISREGLLRYLVSYRLHNDYHENCVERMFRDIMARCRPRALTVEANFLRRGGLDINPVRSTVDIADFREFPRHLRQ